MRKLCLSLIPILAILHVHAQVKRTSVPLGNALSEALAKSSLTTGDTRPFHIRITVSEPGNPSSPYQGTIEEWWSSKDKWRREVTDKDGMHQTIVFIDGSKSEHDEGEYFPLWLNRFVTAAFDPIPNAAAFTASGATIDQITMPNGAKSSPNVRLQSKIGTGERATDAFFNISFDSEGRLSFYGSPGYSMEFHNYHKFGRKQAARELADNPEPGTHLVGTVATLEGLEAAHASPDLFTPLATNENKFRFVAVSSAQLEEFTVANPPVNWPAVRSGNTSGQLAMYISVDNSGQVRETWPLNSDNAGLEDPARDQVRKWKLKPAVGSSGHTVQIEGGLGFHFQTQVTDPLPVLTGAQIQQQISNCNYKPTLPKGLLPRGASFKIRVSVNEAGKKTGESFPAGVDWSVIQKAGLDTRNCHFKPYLVDGRPTYYHIDFEFTAP